MAAKGQLELGFMHSSVGAIVYSFAEIFMETRFLYVSLGYSV